AHVAVAELGRHVRVDLESADVDHRRVRVLALAALQREDHRARRALDRPRRVGRRVRGVGPIIVGEVTGEHESADQHGRRLPQPATTRPWAVGWALVCGARVRGRLLSQTPQNRASVPVWPCPACSTTRRYSTGAYAWSRTERATTR